MEAARLFNNGKSQTARIPAEYSFEGDERYSIGISKWMASLINASS